MSQEATVTRWSPSRDVTIVPRGFSEPKGLGLVIAARRESWGQGFVSLSVSVRPSFGRESLLLRSIVCVSCVIQPREEEAFENTTVFLKSNHILSQRSKARQQPAIRRINTSSKLRLPHRVSSCCQVLKRLSSRRWFEEVSEGCCKVEGNNASQRPNEVDPRHSNAANPPGAKVCDSKRSRYKPSSRQGRACRARSPGN